MNNFWDQLIFNNTVRDWSIAFAIIIASVLVLGFFRVVIIKKALAFTGRTKSTFDDFIITMIQASVMPLLYVFAVYFGLQYINMPARASRIEHIALMVFVAFFMLRIITSFIGYVFKKGLARKEKNQHRENQLKGILLIMQICIWLIGILFLIDNLGYDITTLIAGLGIGGIAIALAAQTILGDLFSYLVIFFDKPFEIGDFISVQDKSGTVEYIGIKSTRLRTLGGEQLICSNTDLTNSRVHNFKRMQERRIAFNFGIIYNTPAAKIKIVPELVKNIIESAGDTRFDRAHFLSFGDFSLRFEVVYFILSDDFNLYMDRQQSINLKIMELFEHEKIEFAFPTQTVFVKQEGG